MLFKVIKREISQSFAHEIVADKFNGCIIGSLVGDCYGKPFRLSEQVSKSQLQSYFDKLDGEYFKAPFKPYSANIAFSLCLGDSLTSLGKFDAVDIAKKFVRTFYQEPNRDYGNNIAKICIKLRATKFADPYKPAAEQYNCAGSFGNSGAARIAPVVLSYLNDPQKMTDIAVKSTEIINSNNMACYGALLQAWAIRLAMQLHPKQDVNCEAYLEELISKVEQFADDDLDRNDAMKFSKQLATVKKLLDVGDATEYDVVNLLGHGKITLYSVPTAIYCFLRGLKPIDSVVASNEFRRTVQYAILLGGDTVSIGGMAGALAGAFYGRSMIGESLLGHCENVPVIECVINKLLKWQMDSAVAQQRL